MALEFRRVRSVDIAAILLVLEAFGDRVVAEALTFILANSIYYLILA
jgi:hypothetical protein